MSNENNERNPVIVAAIIAVVGITLGDEITKLYQSIGLTSLQVFVTALIVTVFLCLAAGVKRRLR